MTLRDPIVIATIRGLLTALGQGALTGLSTYQVTGDGGGSLVVAAIAFLVALGIRGGVEGVWDQRKGPRPEEPDFPLVRGTRNEPAIVHRAPSLDPIPTVDFDQPYHRDPRDGTPHPGNSPGPGCQWCLAVKPVTP